MKAKHLFSLLLAKNQWSLSDVEASIICLLAEKGPLRPRDLAGEIGVTPAGVFSAAKNLLHRKIITKSRHNQVDERAVSYTILEYGKKMLESILEAPANDKT